MGLPSCGLATAFVYGLAALTGLEAAGAGGALPAESRYAGTMSRVGGARPLLDARTPEEASRSVAICFYGLTRSLQYTHDSIMGNLMQPIIDEGYEVDVYLHTYDLARLDSAWSEEHGSLNTTEWQLLQPVASEITSQTGFLTEREFEIEGCKRSGNGWPFEKSFQNMVNLFCQLNSLNRVSRLWRARRGIKDYKAVLYARPDVIYNCRFPVMHLNNLQPRTIYLPDFQHFNGLNDRFMMATPDVAEHVADRIFFAWGTCGTRPIHAERLMQAFADSNNYNVVRMPDFVFFRIRSNGKLVRTDIRLDSGCDRIKLLPDDVRYRLRTERLHPDWMESEKFCDFVDCTTQ